MATLENVQGGSLVADPTSALNLLLSTFGTAQSRQKERDLQQQVETISGGATPQQEQAALTRIAALNPQVANSIRQTLESGDKTALAAIQREAEEGFKQATLINKQKTFGGKKNALLSLARDKVTKNQDPTRTLKLLELNEEQLNLELQRMETIGADISTLAKTNVLSPGQAIIGRGGEVIAERAAAVKPPVSPFAKIKPEEFTPESLQKFSESGRFTDLVPVEKPETRTTLAKNLELAGIDPKSAEGKKIIKESITKPGVKIDLNKGLDFKLPTGFMVDKRDGKIIGVKPIPGGPKDNLSGENAAKAQMLRTARKAAEGIDTFVFDKEGEIDRVNLFNAKFGTPGTQGRELRNKMEFGIQAITRSETGAAMPESEVDNTRERFMPSPFDSKETIQLKLDMFDEFITGTLKLIDPTGRFNSTRFNEELINRGGFPTELEPAAPAPAQAAPAPVAPGQTNQPVIVDF